MCQIFAAIVLDPDRIIVCSKMIDLRKFDVSGWFDRDSFLVCRQGYGVMVNLSGGRGDE